MTACFLPGGGQDDTSPSIERVVPDVSLSTCAGTITVEGENFGKDDLVYLGNRLIREVRIKDGYRLEARIPGDIDEGTYELRVVSPTHRQGARARLSIVPSETAPIIESLRPSGFDPAEGGKALVKGHNFRPGIKAVISGGGRLPCRFIDSGSVELGIPAGLPCGTFDLRLTNKDGESGVLYCGIRIVAAKVRRGRGTGGSAQGRRRGGGVSTRP